MTVKQRLSRSNMLMIVLPIVISLLLTWLLLNLVMVSFGINPPQSNVDAYGDAVKKLQLLDEEWSTDNNLDRILSDLSSLGLSDTLTVEIFHEDKLVYSSGDFSSSKAEALTNTDNVQYVFVNYDYTQNSGDYSIHLRSTHKQVQEAMPNYILLIFWPLAIATVLATVFIVNRFLTHHVFQHIIVPLNTLVDGVHELRDGNLEYRIKYNGKDEFSEVCDDFNEMAKQLSDLMEARKHDDENRRELIAGISHDLRTPLTSIKAYVEGLQKGVATTPALQAEYLEIIKTKTDDLAHIVTQLFQYSKLDIGTFPFKMENIDIGKEIDQYIRQISDEYQRKGLLLSLGENTKKTVITVDIVQLRTVFTNIFENAVKYGKHDDKRMIIGCRKENGNVHLLFRDNGPGVDDEELEKLFNAFFRKDRSRKNPSQGSGLGLAISSKIIEGFRGTIKAENAVGGGLCIHITIPISGGAKHE